MFRMVRRSIIKPLQKETLLGRLIEITGQMTSDRGFEINTVMSG
jgi:hypothetical protein